jgi:hypothetical protein
MKNVRPILRYIFVHSWWVITFVLVCTIFYEKGLEEREMLYQHLTQKLTTLQLEKQRALHQRQNLQLQINSQSDLAWVELTLMKGLGLVPDGHKKVYFFPDERCHSPHRPKNQEEQPLSL